VYRNIAFLTRRVTNSVFNGIPLKMRAMPRVLASTGENRMTTFRDIVTDDFIMKAIDDLGFTEPTEIQALTIPPGVEGKDLIGQAKTGSGKTFAFGIPIMHKLTPERAVQALILAPTRELCQQITIELRKLTKYKKAKIAAVYGGVSINPQIDALQDAQIVVGTPGRILDHLERDTFHTKDIKVLVLDEADRMFDMGFIDDMERIIQAIPAKRQTLLFSATMPQEIKNITKRYQEDPVHIKTLTHVAEELLPQFYYVVEHNKKFSLLVHLIETEKPKLGIIFCATRHIADVVASNLQRIKINAEAIHGGLSQAKRDKVISDFKGGRIHLLIATDVAARGLDIKNVTHVFNYDVPKNPDDYVHRIGRTARAGEAGKAITILENRDFEFFQAVLNLPNVNPTELKADNVKSIGFRKHDDQQRDGEFSGQRRNFRDGPRREGPRSFGQRRNESRGPRREERSERREERPQQSSAGGWKQSRRKR
jgi:ATP-dependent RNA helicase DeaD